MCTYTLNVHINTYFSNSSTMLPDTMNNIALPRFCKIINSTRSRIDSRIRIFYSIYSGTRMCAYIIS